MLVELGYCSSLANQVILGVIEQSSAFGIALYSTCQHSIHNIEFHHGCYAILIIYQSMLSLFMSCVMNMVRLDDLVWILVCCVFGLALAFYLFIRRVGDTGMLG